MANTDKQNFRCDTQTRWRPAMDKLAAMRADGWDVDMTLVLGEVVDFIRDAEPYEIAQRFELEKA